MKSWHLKIFIALLVALPSIIFRFFHLEHTAPIGLVIFGIGIVSSAFLLAWGAEAAEKDIPASMAVAILALIAVLPEYAVDLYFAYRAGHSPDYAPYAIANMTGSNRLLIGVGWSLVALISCTIISMKSKFSVKSLLFEAKALLHPRRRIELGFLILAGIYAFSIPLMRRITTLDGVVLISLFFCYAWSLSQCERDEPELVGIAEDIGNLPKGKRRAVIIALFLYAAFTILCCAKPFANALINSGKSWGIDEFLLVQWLAPLASEAPEFLVAILLALKAKNDSAMGTLLSSKVNQWTLLIGSVPFAYFVGGGGLAMALDTRQVEEVFLTASQTILGIAFLLTLSLSLFDGVVLLILFLVQFIFPQTEIRLWISGVYLFLGLIVIFIRRKALLPILDALLRPKTTSLCE